MKRYITVLLLSLFCMLPVVAQQQNGGRPRFNPEDFQNRMKTFIKDRACLSQQEADAVFPVFFEMKQKQMELTRQIGGLKMDAFKKSDEKECSELLKQITALDVSSSKLEQTYYAKMAKLVGAKKAVNIMFADDAFHREILSWSSNARGGGHNRGGRPGGK